MDDLLSKAVAKQHYLKNLITSLEEELKVMPEGSLSLKTIKGLDYYYHYDNASRTQKYIKRENEDLACTLKRKIFVKKYLKQLYNNYLATNLFIKKYSAFGPDNILNQLSKAYRDIPLKYYKDIFPNAGWQNEEYERNQMHPEKLLHNTSQGIKVRSKSETIIVEILKSHNIPFKYEAALKLGDLKIYPDFTILKPRDGQLIYWEHFGMVNDEVYVNKMNKKLALFNEHGITPWNNLITTFDSEDGTIDTEVITNVIKLFIK